MKYVRGNLIEMFERNEVSVIIHGCNCQKKMASGFAGQLVKKYPSIKEEDEVTNSDAETKLGSFTYVGIGENNDNKVIINAYTQLNYGRDPTVVYVDYVALRKCFRRIACFLKNFEDVFGGRYKIGIPKIGAGLANGDWSIISAIIEEEMKGLDLTVVEYDK